MIAGGWLVNITKWDAATWIAAVGAVIALGAALAAGLQARAAKRSATAADVQATAAKDQAQAAKDQAQAAKDQAQAAEDQVAIMQQQLDAEKADRHEGRGPDFTIPESTIEGEWAGKPVARIMVTQEGGPGLSEVTVTTQRNENVCGLIGNDADNTVPSIPWTDNAPGTTRQLKVSLETKYTEPVNVVLHFESVDSSTGATWWRTKTTNPSTPFQIDFDIRGARREPEIPQPVNLTPPRKDGQQPAGPPPQ